MRVLKNRWTGTMSKWEDELIDLIRNNLVCIIGIAVTFLGIFIRFCCKDFVSGDMQHYLLPWYEVIKMGGIKSLSRQVGDYNIPYQSVIYLLTLIPIKPLYAYKIFSGIFDFALAITAAMIVDDKPGAKLVDRIRSERFILTYSAVILCPLVFFNSALWGQCDAIWSFFVFASFYAFTKRKYPEVFILYGLALSFKLQAVFVLPFLLILYLKEKKYSIINFLIVPVMLIITALPGIIMGRSVIDPFLIYLNQTGTYDAVSMNYNSFWNCIVREWAGKFNAVAVLFTAALLGLVLLKVLKHDRSMTTYRLVFLLHITVYTCVLFLPTMHERYGFVYEVTGIMLMVMNKKFFFPGIGCILLSCITYGHYLSGLEYSLLLTSVINVLLYGWYMYCYFTQDELAIKQ